MLIDCRILALDELVPWPGTKAQNAVVSRCAILQRGTKDGRTSLALQGQLPSGEWISLELTARSYMMIAALTVEAANRFGDDVTS